MTAHDATSNNIAELHASNLPTETAKGDIFVPLVGDPKPMADATDRELLEDMQVRTAEAYQLIHDTVDAAKPMLEKIQREGIMSLLMNR